MLPHNLPRRHATGACRLDKLAFGQALGLGAHDHGGGQPQGENDGDKQGDIAAAEQKAEQYHQDNIGKAVQNLDQPHHQPVGATASIARYRTI